MSSDYDDIASVYHLVYADWGRTVERQAADLDAVLRERWTGASRLLDVSCGIGTQALGLAALGYGVTASDISPAAVARAEAEAEKRGLAIDFDVADMRDTERHHGADFDALISCDNSLPHLTTDDEILAALRGFHSCLRVGGACLISVRDYDAEDVEHHQILPYGTREAAGTSWLVWQVRHPHPPLYDVEMYYVADAGQPHSRTRVLRTTYYAIGTGRLLELMREAGFTDVERLDGAFFQPLLIGTRRE